jgi:hypothetical protein
VRTTSDDGDDDNNNTNSFNFGTSSNIGSNLFGISTLLTQLSFSTIIHFHFRFFLPCRLSIETHTLSLSHTFSQTENFNLQSDENENRTENQFSFDSTLNTTNIGLNFIMNVFRIWKYLSF